MDQRECCRNTLIAFVKWSWSNFPEEHKRTFLSIIKNPGASVNTLTFDARLDRMKINISLAALEALQLVEFQQKGTAKLYNITTFGESFAENELHINIEEGTYNG